METLCAYVRENAGPAMPPPSGDLQANSFPMGKGEEKSAAQKYREALRPPTVDIAAVLQVLGRRSVKGREYEVSQSELSGNRDLWRLDLSGCQLARAALGGLNFQSANFAGSVMVFAKLQNGNFSDARFDGAFLANADLSDARLIEADFQGAHLEGAKLIKAQMQAAELTSADFSGADFTAADLRFACFYRKSDSIEWAAQMRVKHPSVYLGRAISLSGADLSSALLDFLNLQSSHGLTQEQINRAYGNEYTTLPHEPSLSQPQNDRWLPTSASPLAQLQRRLEWQRNHTQFLQGLRTERRMQFTPLV